MFADLLARRNQFGLLSEDIHPATGELWGNLPQTYSMAGIVNTGRILSRSWQEAWATLRRIRSGRFAAARSRLHADHADAAR